MNVFKVLFWDSFLLSCFSLYINMHLKNLGHFFDFFLKRSLCFLVQVLLLQEEKAMLKKSSEEEVGQLWTQLESMRASRQELGGKTITPTWHLQDCVWASVKIMFILPAQFSHSYLCVCFVNFQSWRSSCWLAPLGSMTLSVSRPSSLSKNEKSKSCMSPSWKTSGSTKTQPHTWAQALNLDIGMEDCNIFTCCKIKFMFLWGHWPLKSVLCLHQQ